MGDREVVAVAGCEGMIREMVGTKQRRKGAKRAKKEEEEEEEEEEEGDERENKRRELGGYSSSLFETV